MTPELWIAIGGFALSVAAIIYKLGGQGARIDALDEFRRDTAADLKTMRALMENIAGAVGARKSP